MLDLRRPSARVVTSPGAGTVSPDPADPSSPAVTTAPSGQDEPVRSSSTRPRSGRARPAPRQRTGRPGPARRGGAVHGAPEDVAHGSGARRIGPSAADGRLAGIDREDTVEAEGLRGPADPDGDLALFATRAPSSPIPTMVQPWTRPERMLRSAIAQPGIRRDVATRRRELASTVRHTRSFLTATPSRAVRRGTIARFGAVGTRIRHHELAAELERRDGVGSQARAVLPRPASSPPTPPTAHQSAAISTMLPANRTKRDRRIESPRCDGWSARTTAISGDPVHLGPTG